MPIKGLDKAIKDMQARAAEFAARPDVIYRGVSADMKAAIPANADESYNGSPAVDVAVKSADAWIHSTDLHELNIMAPMYANYRQYGCGGLEIHKLVVVNESDSSKMREHFSKSFHRK